jgi:hypothetical protein
MARGWMTWRWRVEDQGGKKVTGPLEGDLYLVERTSNGDVVNNGN